MKVTEKDIDEKGGDIDSCSLYLIRFLIISLVNIADLIISIIYFDPNCMTFFVFKFITIFCIFILYLCLCCAYSYIVSKDGIDFFGPFIVVAVSSIILLLVEIIFLIFFIINFNALNPIVLIFYFIHWAPIIIIYIFLYFRCKLGN